MNRAFFVMKPRNIEELRVPHLLCGERQYEIVCEKKLSAIDYENFVTDMRADRQFILDAASRCCEGEVMKCLLVRKNRMTEGMLIVPDSPSRPDHVLWAAAVTMEKQ